jgi:secondary thiamine-phosphate synthase enzyme
MSPPDAHRVMAGVDPAISFPHSTDVRVRPAHDEGKTGARGMWQSSSMKQQQHRLMIATSGQGLYEFTREAKVFVKKSGIATGQLTLYCRHTSASLVIQENADPDVQRDLTEFFRRIIPEDSPWIVHRTEGPDDMPAHIKSALTHSSLCVPVMEGGLVLGTWQGIFLFEHRSASHRREVVLHVMGE